MESIKHKLLIKRSQKYRDRPNNAMENWMQVTFAFVAVQCRTARKRKERVYNRYTYPTGVSGMVSLCMLE